MRDSILLILQTLLLLVELGTAVVRFGSALLDLHTACLVHKKAVSKRDGDGPGNEKSSRSDD